MKMPKAVREYLAAIGRKGGKAKSAAKRQAVRANGRLGGRPRKHGRVTTG
jgi:hypothetical protein